MKRVLAQELEQARGEKASLAGWVRRVRTVGADLAFVILADRSGEAQLVVSGDLIFALPPLESVITVTGSVHESRSRAYPLEVHAETIEVLSAAEPLPFPLNQKNLEVGLDLIDHFRPLALRHPSMQTTFHLQHEILRHFEEFFSARGFNRACTPKILATGTEGGSELFKVDYFGDTAYLAQSPQFYKQMLVGSGFERVYEIGPVFRAEEHRTSRHLNEFISLDIEQGFVQDVNELMDLEEEFLNSLLVHLQERFSQHLKVPYPLGPIPRLPLAQALDILHRDHGKESPGGNIDPEGERLISAWAEREHGVPGVFLHSYPKSIRPFYSSPKHSEPSNTDSFDLIFRGQEITTGGLRIHDHTQLVKALRERGLEPQTYEFYLQVFKYGMPPHGGFAIGAERLTAQLLGLKNIREASIMPIM